MFEMLQTRNFSLNPNDFKTANHLHIVMRSRRGCDYPDADIMGGQPVPEKTPSTVMQWILWLWQ